MQTMIQIVTDEIEKGTNVGIADALGVRLVALGETIQEPQDIIRCYLIDLVTSEFQTELINDRLVGSNRIFFLEWALW